ncbi:MAG: amidohydrolase family protein [Colwellia sp.]
MTVNIIDPHLHLFNRSRGDYHWLKSKNPPFWLDKQIIQRDFSVDDLTIEQTGTSSDRSTGKKKVNLAGFIHIEAGFDNEQPWRELEYIESIEYQNMSAKSFRTIACVNLLSAPETFKQTLNSFSPYKSLIGVRHILDEEACSILVSHNAQQNFAYLNSIKDFIFELQLPLATKALTSKASDKSILNIMTLLTQTIKDNNQLRFIINHAGFPPKQTHCDAWRLWANKISELAEYPNVYIKCSGLEMSDRNYTMSWFSQVTEYCLRQFSVDRVMIASNFPLCLLSEKLSNKCYSDYWHHVLASTVIKQCSQNEKNALLYGNALRIYRMSNFIASSG